MKMKSSVYPTDGKLFYEGTVPESLLHMFRLSRFFGLLPYGSQIAISPSWYRYSIFTVATLIVGSTGFCVHSLYFTEFLMRNPSMFTTTMLYLTQQGMQVVCLFSHVLSLGLYKKDFNTVLATLPEWTYTGVRSKFAGWWTLIGILFLMFYYTSTPIVAVTSWENYCWYFFAGMNEICIYLILIQFCTFLEIIETQLRNLTLLVTKSRNLVPMTEAHYSFVTRATTINSVYGWQILIICTLIFINFVSWLFNAMQDVMSSSADPISVLLKIMYCAWQIATIYFVAGSCEGVVEKVDLFNYELFRIMRESKNLCDNEKLNLYVSMKQSISFTACGFFSLGYPLVTSIIAAATTYLVILVQFSLSSAQTSSTSATTIASSS